MTTQLRTLSNVLAGHEHAADRTTPPGWSVRTNCGYTKSASGSSYIFIAPGVHECWVKADYIEVDTTCTPNLDWAVAFIPARFIIRKSLEHDRRTPEISQGPTISDSPLPDHVRLIPSRSDESRE
jgi:hypothetical protein